MTPHSQASVWWPGGHLAHYPRHFLLGRRSGQVCSVSSVSRARVACYLSPTSPMLSIYHRQSICLAPRPHSNNDEDGYWNIDPLLFLILTCDMPCLIIVNIKSHWFDDWWSGFTLFTDQSEACYHLNIIVTTPSSSPDTLSHLESADHVASSPDHPPHALTLTWKSHLSISPFVLSLI